VPITSPKQAQPIPLRNIATLRRSTVPTEITHNNLQSTIDLTMGVYGRDLGRLAAGFLLADGKFIILDEDGNIGLATPSPQGLTVHSKVALLDHNAWTIPTLVGTKLYVRDRKTIMALEVGHS
jgi:hypothetical protein